MEPRQHTGARAGRGDPIHHASSRGRHRVRAHETAGGGAGQADRGASNARRSNGDRDLSARPGASRGQSAAARPRSDEGPVLRQREPRATDATRPDPGSGAKAAVCGRAGGHAAPGPGGGRAERPAAPGPRERSPRSGEAGGGKDGRALRRGRPGRPRPPHGGSFRERRRTSGPLVHGGRSRHGPGSDRCRQDRAGPDEPSLQRLQAHPGWRLGSLLPDARRGGFEAGGDPRGLGQRTGRTRRAARARLRALLPGGGERDSPRQRHRPGPRDRKGVHRDSRGARSAWARLPEEARWSASSSRCGRLRESSFARRPRPPPAPGTSHPCESSSHPPGRPPSLPPRIRRTMLVHWSSSSRTTRR